VTATATPNASSTFAGWSGDCDASGQVTLDANKTCTATFEAIIPTLPDLKAGSPTPSNSFISVNTPQEFTT